MRREVLKGQHVAGGQGDHGLGIAGSGEFAEPAEEGGEIFDGAIVVYDDDERTLGAPPPEHEQQGFGGRSEAGNTCPPRALPQVGGYTREGGKFFHVREEFADEGKQHAGLI